MKKISLNEDGFTGLEAAIVLIAFVVVAAVFSYVVLGAGFFTTQQSQKTVTSGVQQASSSLQTLGSVYGIVDGNDTTISEVRFTIGLPAGGSDIDMSKATVTYADSLILEQVDFDTVSGTAVAGNWTVYEVINEQGTANDEIETNEQFVISVGLPTTATVEAYDEFTIELKPNVGAVLSITKSAPAGLDAINVLS